MTRAVIILALIIFASIVVNSDSDIFGGCETDMTDSADGHNE